MSEPIKTKIPAEMEPAAVGGMVTDAKYIIDRVKNKNQTEINIDVGTEITNIKGGSNKSIANLDSEINGNGGIDERLGTVEELAEISIGGGDAQIATGSDFTNPDVAKRAKVPTVGAILDGLNDGVYDVSKRNPTGGENNDGKFTLAYILANADTLIPTSWRHGGMTISFVDSYDNNYVQYRCIADEFTTNTDKWAIDSEEVLVENPEYMAVYLDADKRIIKAIKNDGTEYLAVGVETETLKVLNGAEVHGVIDTDGTVVTMIDNLDFFSLWLDKDNRILFGVQNNGNFFFGAGVPKQIVDYIERRIADLSLDEYENIVAFLNGLETGEKTLSELLAEKADAESVIAALATKVDKAEGKSLIDEDVADKVHYIENPEFIKVELDSEGHIIKAIKNDGTEYLAVGVDIAGVAIEKGIESPEFIGVFLDAKSRIIMAFEENGNVLYGCGVPRQIKKFVENNISNIQTFLSGFEDNITLLDYLNNTYGEYVDNPEYIETETDADNRLLGGRKSDGKKFESVGYETPNISIDGTKIETINSPEERCDVETDSEKRILSYRDKDGYKVECVGYIPKSLKLPTDAKKEVKNIAGSIIKDYNLPKFGTVDIVSETFYLTAEGWSSYTDDVELRQDYPDTDANAANKVTLCNFYIVGTDTKLDFYAASKVTKVDSKYYVTSTLTEVIDPETGDISYEVNENSVEVTKVTDVPPYKAWPVDKNTEHYCVVSIDFGDYLSGTFYVGVKYQGSSTLSYRKRNFRFTFYKNSSYSKKNKIKIGEFVRLSGFNLKANFVDNTRVLEFTLNKLLMAVWEHRNIYDQYPWNKKHTPYTGATGMIKGFPVECRVGGVFYGLDIFGEKKDGKNYILDKDEDGMIEGGSTNTGQCWINTSPAAWEDELNDEEDWVIDNQTQSNYDALTAFFAFINERLYNGSDGNAYDSTQLTEVDGTMYVTSTLEGGVPVASSVSATLIPFNKKTMPERMSMLDWIDYLICIQVFLMSDNTCRNLMLYTDSDKKKFYPFFYDLDSSLRFDLRTYNRDIMIPRTPEHEQAGDWGSYAEDMSLWENIKNEWWDEIVNRYHELRNSVLSDSYIENVANSVSDSIPQDVLVKETNRWNISIKSLRYDLELIRTRMNWLDRLYYK